MSLSALYIKHDPASPQRASFSTPIPSAQKSHLLNLRASVFALQTELNTYFTELLVAEGSILEAAGDDEDDDPDQEDDSPLPALNHPVHGPAKKKVKA
jgi:hypothetical protein